MANGGARPGAGRKKGGKNDPVKAAVRTVGRSMRKVLEEKGAQIAERVAAERTPLEVMLQTMQELMNRADECKVNGRPFIEKRYQEGMTIAGEGESPTQALKELTPLVHTETQLRMLAVEVASKAAPFVHPKLSQVEGNLRINPYEQSLLELAAGNDATGA